MRFLLILLLTAAAMWVAYKTPRPPVFINSLIVSGDETESESEARYIREYVPVRLVQPEWVSKSNLYMNWAITESMIRLGLVGTAWLATAIWIFQMDWNRNPARNDS